MHSRKFTLADKISQFAFNQADNYETIKVNSKLYIDCLKTYYALMVNGGTGQSRLKSLKSKKTLQEKYHYLVKTMDKNEERLPLWLALDEEDKLKMITAQYIEGEAEVLTMLLMEEVEQQPGATFKLDDMDRKLERALDN